MAKKTNQKKEKTTKSIFKIVSEGEHSDFEFDIYRCKSLVRAACNLVTSECQWYNEDGEVENEVRVLLELTDAGLEVAQDNLDRMLSEPEKEEKPC